MDDSNTARRSRREFLQAAGITIAGFTLCGAPRAFAQGGASSKLRIGMIGSGRVGSTLGALWVKAGHEVMFSSLNIDYDRKLAASIGPGALAGTPKEAAAFGEVLFFSVPYAALPALGRELAQEIKGKIVLDASNPVPTRDGDMAKDALARGTGVASPELLAGARLVRVYNAVNYNRMREDAHRAGERLGIPLAGDDAQAVKMAVRLVQDAGHEPVVVGGLARAKDFDYNSPVFVKHMTAAELRQALGVKP
jgi:predicted dinucleotide-binding enzyme